VSHPSDSNQNQIYRPYTSCRCNIRDAGYCDFLLMNAK
jgi:hypothetical protein